MAALAPAARATYRRLLEDVYRKWSPDKMEKVPDLLEKYAGQEDEVYDKAVRMYVFPQAREVWLPLIEGMYRRFNPDKLTGDPAFLRQVLKKYEGSEANLFKALCNKYINSLGEKDPPLELCTWGAGARGPGRRARGPRGGSEGCSPGSCSSVSACSPQGSPRAGRPQRLQMRSRQEVESQRRQPPAAPKARPRAGVRAASAEPKPRPKRRRTDAAAPPGAPAPEPAPAAAALPAKPQRARRAPGAAHAENVAEPSADRQVRTPPRRRARHGGPPPQEATRAEQEARAQSALDQVVSAAASEKREHQALRAFVDAAPACGSEGGGARFVDAVVEVRGQAIHRMRLPVTVSLGAVAKMYERWAAAAS